MRAHSDYCSVVYSAPVDDIVFSMYSPFFSFRFDDYLHESLYIRREYAIDLHNKRTNE